MESRRIGLSSRNNQHENILIGKKVDNAQSRFPKSRPALRDVGNKLVTQTLNDGPIKNVIKLQKPETTLTKAIDSTKDNISKLKISCKTADECKVKPKVLPKPLIHQDSVIDKTTAFSSKRLVIYDPDEGSKHDLLAVTEYVEDIFTYLRETEAKYAIEKDHLEDHHTTPAMRSTLVNWLIELQVSFKLNVETVYMCVSLVDRYLQVNKDIGKETLQLVGVSALMIASKFEEIYIPDISDFVYVCDDSYSPRQILSMEKDILGTLQFNIGNPSPIHFLRRFSKVARANMVQHCLAKYLLELGLLDHQMCYVLPSHQAAAACCLAIAIMSEEMDLSKIWSPTLVHYTTYRVPDFKHVIRRFAVLLSKEDKSKYRAVSEKYAQPSNHKISTNPKLKGRLVTKLILERQS